MARESRAEAQTQATLAVRRKRESELQRPANTGQNAPPQERLHRLTDAPTHRHTRDEPPTPRDKTYLGVSGQRNARQSQKEQGSEHTSLHFTSLRLGTEGLPALPRQRKLPRRCFYLPSVFRTLKALELNTAFPTHHALTSASSRRRSRQQTSPRRRRRRTCRASAGSPPPPPPPSPPPLRSRSICHGARVH